MSKNLLQRGFLCLVLCFSATIAIADHGMQKGKSGIEQAGALAFGPDGVLLVGDSMSASIYAFDTGDQASEATPVNIEGINAKIAAMVGSDTSEVTINDVAVSPVSNQIYVSASRGRGPDATPLIFRTDAKGELSLLDLDDISFSKVAFSSAPAKDAKDRRGRPLRMNAITDIHFDNGKVIVAGLSNEEFASKLRVFDFPFAGGESATSIEVYHGAHGRLETQSPVRTFITYENTVLAAYTCTPLVTIPVEKLNGDKIMGKTVAELGNRNNPLDMIIYRKGDQDYLLMANDRRGVMKMQLDKSEMDSIDAIRSRVSGGGTAGLKYETVEEFSGVAQLAKLGDSHAVMLVVNADNMDLKTVALP